MQDQPLDILTLNETRLDSTVRDCEVEITGYDIVRKDRNRNGGGVAVYIRKRIPYINRQELIPNVLEAICIEVNKPKSKPLLVTTWYRPPNSKIELFHYFEKFLESVDDENKELVIAGDLNCNLLQPEGNSYTSKLLDIMNTFQLQQHIRTPTRTTPLSQTLLDVIFTYISDNKTIEAGVIELGISDHNLVYLCRKIGIPKKAPKIVFTRQFKNYNANQFRHDVSETLNLNTSSNDPNILWFEWKTKFLGIVNKHAPVKQRRVKSEYKPWLTKEIKTLSYHRDYLKRKAIRLGSSNYNEAYKKCKNKLNKLIKTTKEEYFKTKLSNANNSKDSWQAINELLNNKVKTTHIKQLNVGDQIVEGDQKIATSFNKYFSTIGSKLAEEIPSSDTDPLIFVTPAENSFQFRLITNLDLASALHQMKTKKSPGVDGIAMRLLKDAGYAVIETLVEIFNVSIQTGIFPDDWKFAKVSPIYKEGDKSDCGNYRPISVISAVAKLFEKLMYAQLSSFLIENNIINEQQSGFRPKHSTETALLASTNEWLSCMDKGKINGVLFLDLKKAFDTVNHDILISKLELYGIRGISLEWFRSYLQKRKQICMINNECSDVMEISCGVPQGSNLGPLLFLLYINDLPSCLETTKATLFADDTNLSCSGSTVAEVEDKLNKDLENVNKWLMANKLTMNKVKTKFMIIGSNKRLALITESPQITIGGYRINRVFSKKILGLVLDENLKWDKHIEEQSKKISQNIALLRRAKSFLPQKDLVTMYNAFVLPYFTYCSTVWSDGCLTQIEKLSKLQRRAARVITGDIYEVHSSEILKKLVWLPIDKILKNREIITTFKALTGMLPKYISELFNKCNNTNYNLRSNDIKLSLDKPNTNFMKKSFSYRATISWNELPDEIIENLGNLTVPSLKRRLRSI